MAEFKKLPTQAELQQMLYMGQLQGKSPQDIISENLARGTTIKALPESFFTTAGAGARQAAQFVNRAGTAQDLAKLFPGYTGKATIPIPTRFNFAAKMDPYSGQAIPGGLQTQQIPYGDILKAIKPADVLGLTGTAQAYSDIGAGKAPSPMDVLDTIGLGAVMAKPAQLGFKAGKGLLEATKGLPVGMSIQDVSKAGQQLPVVPETMYHGTASDIQAFRPGNTVYVTPSPKFAESYAGTQSPNIMPLRADVTKPFNYENAADIEKLANTYKKIHGEDLFAKKTISSAGGEMKLSQLDKNPISQRLKSGDWTIIEDKKVQEAIKKAGFDAFYIEEGGVKNLGVYDPTKLKSVFSPSVNPPGLLGTEAAQQSPNIGYVGNIGTAPRKLPLTDMGEITRFTKPLPAGQLYRETSPNNLMDLFKGSTPFGSPVTYFSEVPEMALGQGANKGVMIKVNSEGLKGRPFLGKPGLEQAYLQRAGEFEIKEQPNNIIKAINEVWVSPDAYKNLRKAEVVMFNRQLSDLEKSGVKVNKVDKLPNVLEQEKPVVQQQGGLLGVEAVPAVNIKSTGLLQPGKLSQSGIVQEKIGDSTISYQFGDDGVLKIFSLRTPQLKRGQGSATEAMNQIIKKADDMGIPIKLDASPLDKKTSLNKLVDFYKKFGFKTTGEKVNMLNEPVMYRNPKK